MFEELECWHGGYLLRPRNRFAFVDVHLDKYHIGVFLAKALKLGGNRFARATPSGRKVHYNEFIASLLGKNLLEFLLRCHFSNHDDNADDDDAFAGVLYSSSAFVISKLLR
jgi:hypothetical protein